MPEDSAVTADKIAQRIEESLTRNWYLEVVIAVGIGILFLTGVGLLIFGFVTKQNELTVTGGILELTIVVPLGRLMDLRKENIRLQIIPEMIRFAEDAGTKQSKEASFQFVMKLIEKV